MPKPINKTAQAARRAKINAAKRRRSAALENALREALGVASPRTFAVVQKALGDK